MLLRGRSNELQTSQAENNPGNQNKLTAEADMELIPPKGWTFTC